MAGDAWERLVGGKSAHPGAEVAVLGVAAGPQPGAHVHRRAERAEGQRVAGLVTLGLHRERVDLGQRLHQHPGQRGRSGGPAHQRTLDRQWNAGVAERHQPTGVVDVDDPWRIGDHVADEVRALAQRLLATGGDLPQLHQVRDLVLGAGVVDPGRGLVAVLHPLGDQDLRVADLRLVVEPHHRLVQAVDIVQRLGHQGALDRVLARRLAALAGTEVLDVAPGGGREMHLTGAERTVERGVVAPVQGERRGALGKRIEHHLLRDLDQLAVILQSASRGIEHPRRAFVVAAHAAFTEYAHRRVLDQHAFLAGDGMYRTDQLAVESFHLRLPRPPLRPPTRRTPPVPGR